LSRPSFALSPFREVAFANYNVRTLPLFLQCDQSPPNGGLIPGPGPPFDLRFSPRSLGLLPRPSCFERIFELFLSGPFFEPCLARPFSSVDDRARPGRTPRWKRLLERPQF